MLPRKTVTGKHNVLCLIFRIFAQRIHQDLYANTKGPLDWRYKSYLFLN